MAMSQSAFRATSVEHPHPAGETCPLCEQPIPNDRAEEIRAKLEGQKRRDEAAMKARVDQQVADMRTELEKAKKAEVEKIQQDNAALIEKTKTEALTQQNAAREEGKKAAHAEAQQKLDVMAAEREVAKTKLQQAEEQKTAALAQLEAQKAQTEQIAAARAAEARAATEKSYAEANKAKDAQHAEAMQKVADQLKAVERRLHAEEGEGANINLFDVLRQKFPKDDIKRTKNSSGADIVHVVKHNNKECGVIVYDSRNRNAWNPKFASELRRDMIAAKAMHAILTTGKFPQENRQVCRCDGVILAALARVAFLAEMFREEIIRGYGQRMSTQDRDRKTARLYDFITSERFDNILNSLATNDEKLLALDEDEQKVHKKTWEKRRVLTTNSQKLHGSLRSDVERILGTAETD